MNSRNLTLFLTFLLIPICVSCKKKPAESVIEIIESTESRLYSTKTLNELENMQYDMLNKITSCLDTEHSGYRFIDGSEDFEKVMGRFDRYNIIYCRALGKYNPEINLNNEDDHKVVTVLALLKTMESRALTKKDGFNPRNSKITSMKMISDQKHLTFKNIPIDGPLKDFIDKLKKEGITVDEVKNEGTWLNGQFAGQMCKVLVQSTAVTHTVHSVYALFPIHSSWSEMIEDYDLLKTNLSRKYGEPITIEVFNSPYTEGDGREMNGSRNKKVTWESDYYTNIGDIYLYIHHAYSKPKTSNEYVAGRVIIKYEDKTNSAKVVPEIESDL